MAGGGDAAIDDGERFLVAGEEGFDEGSRVTAQGAVRERRLGRGDGRRSAVGAGRGGGEDREVLAVGDAYEVSEAGDTEDAVGGRDAV